MVDQRSERRASGASDRATGGGVPRHPLECCVRRIEGQVRGVLHMPEEDRGTDEILIQIASNRRAIHGLEQKLVDIELKQFVEGVLPWATGTSRGAEGPEGVDRSPVEVVITLRLPIRRSRP